MIEQKQKVIGGTTYAVTQLNAFEALKIQTKLLRIIGPGIAGLDVDDIQSADDEGALKQKFISMITKILPEMFATLDDTIVNDLINMLFAHNVFIVKNGFPEVIKFDDHFVGKPLEIWKVAGFILEVNFASGKSSGSNSPTTPAAEATQEVTT